jgi:hypothetical protein
MRAWGGGSAKPACNASSWTCGGEENPEARTNNATAQINSRKEWSNLVLPSLKIQFQCQLDNNSRVVDLL